MSIFLSQIISVEQHVRPLSVNLWRTAQACMQEQPKLFNVSGWELQNAQVVSHRLIYAPPDQLFINTKGRALNLWFLSVCVCISPFFSSSPSAWWSKIWPLPNSMTNISAKYVKRQAKFLTNPALSSKNVNKLKHAAVFTSSTHLFYCTSLC